MAARKKAGPKPDMRDELLVQAADKIAALEHALILSHREFNREKKGREMDVAILVSRMGGEVEIPRNIVETIQKTEGLWRTEVETTERGVTARIVAFAEDDAAGPP